MLFLILTFFAWAMSDFKNKTISNYMALLISLSSILLFLLIGKVPTSFLFLTLIPICAFALYQLYAINKPAPLNIEALQQSYCSKITPKMVIQANAHRCIPKKDRLETRVNVPSKQFYRYIGKRKFFTTNFFHELAICELTHIESIDALRQYCLYSFLFDKVKEVIDFQEKRVDFNSLLQDNKNKAEFLLLELFETYTRNENIGMAHLHILAQRPIEKELIGAIDNVLLKNVKRHGAALFYLYMYFKQRIPKKATHEF